MSKNVCDDYLILTDAEEISTLIKRGSPIFLSMVKNCFISAQIYDKACDIEMIKKNLQNGMEYYYFKKNQLKYLYKGTSDRIVLQNALEFIVKNGDHFSSTFEIIEVAKRALASLGTDSIPVFTIDRPVNEG
jgi:uncharacterized membrane protein